ncbi:maleylpyruvate isomerase family mycothiol-dependent enzyme [Leekyejoonella antrihumi]|uniref:Maleylpyruvate isomerase family mycothiol-dependent enzyme n=1 Tax=Leekyejoonella antrihumi TaxID=1660198 RepID=A0A563E268_9MICO|nr:maleylpyruvate isomerase family mycothiol-dependent enzyme [Leekyejoonella antrihumi]TWP36640.1 maleylpyruvate isomerase family mycothiol-dependent enzyme [Leekyejoonella antrihumi]
MKYAHWMTLAADEYALILELLGELDQNDWSRPTGCAPWTVRDVVAHLAGAAEATASVREQMRQQRAGKLAQAGRDRMTAVNELQIRERLDLTPTQLSSALADAARRGVAARAKIPAPVRAPKFRFPAPLGWASLGHLNGAIYTRDAWMHRIDLCEATGHKPVLTADHDGAIVADVVSEWNLTRRNSLDLTGPAGGRFGAEAPPASYDAVDFCRALAGRGNIDGVEPALALF